MTNLPPGRSPPWQLGKCRCDERGRCCACLGAARLRRAWIANVLESLRVSPDELLDVAAEMRARRGMGPVATSREEIDP
jgi:hypothetical protein